MDYLLVNVRFCVIFELATDMGTNARLKIAWEIVIGFELLLQYNCKNQSNTALAGRKSSSPTHNPLKVAFITSLSLELHSTQRTGFFAVMSVFQYILLD